MTKSKLMKSDVRFAYLTVVPVLLIILIVRGYPLIMSLIYSFTNWDGLGKMDAVGLKNYLSLLRGREFWQLLKNTATLLLYIPLQLLLGLVFALFLFEQKPGWKVFRVVFYLPQVISMTIVGYVFAIIFSYDGAINAMLRAVGLDAAAVEWFGNASTAYPIIIFCLVWMNIGWQALIFSGGLASVDYSVLESARLDGAGYFQRMFRVLLPMLGRTIEYSVVISVIWVFTALFPLIFTMTQGGPGYETTTIDYMIYRLSFREGRMALSCALSMVLTVILLIITRIEYYVSDKANDWQ